MHHSLLEERIALHCIALLTSQWKSGKTTLISVLLSRLGKGGVLAGQPVSAGRAVVVSEEDIGSWRERDQVLPLGDHIDWFFQPFLGKATYEDWRALLEQIGRIHEEHPIQLLVIDSLANLSPMRSENEASEMLKTLQPLQALTSRGISVLVLHHPQKRTSLPGQSARGSGALSGSRRTGCFPPRAVGNVPVIDAAQRSAMSSRRLSPLMRHRLSNPRAIIPQSKK